ncbi:zinc transporter ZIP13, partial [Biomphalaria pfeifferi]
MLIQSLAVDLDIGKNIDQDLDVFDLSVIENIQIKDGVTEIVIETKSVSFETWFLSILASILVGLSGLFPLLVIPMETGQALKHGEPAKRLRLMLSFAVGSLLGDVFLHLLPELWADIKKDSMAGHKRIGLWVIAGLLAFMIMEKLFGDETEFEQLQDTCDEIKSANFKVQSSTKTKHNKICNSTKNIKHNKIYSSSKNMKRAKGQLNKLPKYSSLSHSENNKLNPRDTKIGSVPVAEDMSSSNIKVSGYLNLMANVVDNFTHGLAVAASFCISTKVGFITTLAILLHEIPHEVGDFAILLRSGFNRWKAAKAQFLTASGSVVGAITALTSESSQVSGEKTAWILPFTSGGFMYIALVTVMPDLLQEKHG